MTTKLLNRIANDLLTRLLVTGLVILLPATVQTIPFPRRETP